MTFSMSELQQTNITINQVFHYISNIPLSMFTNVSDEYSTGRRKWIGCPPVSKRAGGRKEERKGEAGQNGKRRFQIQKQEKTNLPLYLNVKS